jgi:putative transposase
LTGSKKKLDECLSVDERRALVEKSGGVGVSLRRQVDILSLSRRALYYQPIVPADEAELCQHINSIYAQHPFYGVRRIAVTLKQAGMVVNHKRVQRLMQRMGLQGIRPKPNLSRRRHDEQVYPYLLDGVKASYPNHIWGIDITYIPQPSGWLYLAAVIDWYSRYVISWSLEQSLAQPLVTSAVVQALKVARPTIFNSDQGGHFTSPQYLSLLQEQGVQISMDGKRRAIDNVLTERLWRSIKYEEVYLNEYRSPAEVRRRVGEYVQFYNEQRPHQSLGYRTPASVYWAKDNGDGNELTATNNQKGDAILKTASLWSQQWGTPQIKGQADLAIEVMKRGLQMEQRTSL